MEEIEGVLKRIGVATSKVNLPTTSSTEHLSEESRHSQARPESSRRETSQSAPRSGTDDTCPRCGGIGFVRRDVPVGHPDFGRAIPCQCKLSEIAQARLADLWRVSNMNFLAHMTFDSFVAGGIGLTPEKRNNLRRAYQEAQQYAGNPKGWLIFKGGYGCGKTHLAAAIANYRLQQGEPVLFVVVPDLLDHLRATFSPTSPVTYDERFDTVRNTPLLILDDLGTQSATPWAHEKLYQIFNHRYNAQLPTVITTNCELEEIDERLRSRVVDPTLCTICTILAPDYRQSGAESGIAELSSLSLHGTETFETFDLRAGDLPAEERENLRQAYALAQTYAQQPDGWLVLCGDYGCGKTHLAAAIANYRLQRGESVLFVVVPDLLDHLRATFNPSSPVSYDKRFEEIRTAPLLVLDDLGTESATPWAKEKLYQIFNYRYSARLPTVITMKQTVEEVDARLRARMLDWSRCTVYAILAPSYGSGHALKSQRQRGRSRRRP